MSPLYVVLFLPLIGAVINRLFGARLGKRASAGLACAAVLTAFAFAVSAFLGLSALAPAARSVVTPVYGFLTVGSFKIGFDLLLDPLSAVMICVVTGIGSLIHIYSVAYMEEEDDAEYARFFAYINFFVFSMLTLVLAANFMVIFTGWELVGVSSYLLIGYYRGKTSAADAGKKAFIVNRVGDLGFLLGIFIIMGVFGSLDFGVVLPHAALLGAGSGLATATALLLFMGAMGKSAQGPLYVWLPDAMEGPTPVSALIHAATMVTAGVFLVARCHAIFELSPTAMGVVAWIGGLTALYAATIAMVQADIKRVLAYSTVSQLGYMVMGVGLGAYTAGFFHLLTHAFFKALLFLGAGSVMHALHGELDMHKMGGLRKKMPITHITFVIGACCLAGVPLTSGFFSKDEILYMAIAGPHASLCLWVVGYLGACCTAFYSGRLVFQIFYGKPRDHHAYDHAHESAWPMALPLVVLAVGSLAVGLLGLPKFASSWQPFSDWLAPVFADVKTAPEADGGSLVYWLMLLYTATVAFLGWLSYQWFAKENPKPTALAARWNGLYRLLWNKYYVDEFYQLVFVRAFLGYSRWLWRWVDQGIIDGAVNAVGGFAQHLGALLRERVQNGQTRQYAAFLMAGVCLLLGLVFIYGGGR
ncbi:MAG TPA: NADH-quinone oxidoreductase subunit L [bacterium]|nr:NADH-quinone oxidoreductase subunit L [bacterium]